MKAIVHLVGTAEEYLSLAACLSGREEKEAASKGRERFGKNVK